MIMGHIDGLLQTWMQSVLHINTWTAFIHFRSIDLWEKFLIRAGKRLIFGRELSTLTKETEQGTKCLALPKNP